MDWELWWQITVWMVLAAICIVVIKNNKPPEEKP